MRKPSQGVKAAQPSVLSHVGVQLSLTLNAGPSLVFLQQLAASLLAKLSAPRVDGTLIRISVSSQGGLGNPSMSRLVCSPTSSLDMLSASRRPGDI